MNKLWKYLSSKLSKTEATPVYQAPLIHEEYKINWDQPAYLEWLESSKIRYFLNIIYQAYIDTLSNQNHSPFIDFTLQKTYSGLRLKAPEDTWNKQDYLFLQMYLAQKTKSLDYILKMSEIKTKSKNAGLETIYNIYLKPSHNYKVEIPVDQRYGNVQLELVIHDELVSYLRVKLMVYQDRNYQPASDFGEWLKIMCH